MFSTRNIEALIIILHLIVNAYANYFVSVNNFIVSVPFMLLMLLLIVIIVFACNTLRFTNNRLSAFGLLITFVLLSCISYFGIAIVFLLINLAYYSYIQAVVMSYLAMGLLLLVLEIIVRYVK